MWVTRESYILVEMCWILRMPWTDRLTTYVKQKLGLASLRLLMVMRVIPIPRSLQRCLRTTTGLNSHRSYPEPRGALAATSLRDTSDGQMRFHLKA